MCKRILSVQELDDWMTVHVCRHAHHADGSWHMCFCTALTLAHIHAQASEEVLINSWCCDRYRSRCSRPYLSVICCNSTT